MAFSTFTAFTTLLYICFSCLIVIDDLYLSQLHMINKLKRALITAWMNKQMVILKVGLLIISVTLRGHPDTF